MTSASVATASVFATTPSGDDPAGDVLGASGRCGELADSMTAAGAGTTTRVAFPRPSSSSPGEGRFSFSFSSTPKDAARCRNGDFVTSRPSCGNQGLARLGDSGGSAAALRRMAATEGDEPTADLGAGLAAAPPLDMGVLIGDDGETLWNAATTVCGTGDKGLRAG